MTPRERAEKYEEQYAKKLEDGWTTPDRIDFFEQIIKDEIAACVLVEKGIGNFFGVLGHSMLDRVLKFKEGIEIEREACAKICDQDEAQGIEMARAAESREVGMNYTFQSQTAHKLAARIRARGKSAEENLDPRHNSG